MDVGRSCTADDVVAVIERLVAARGAPEHLRMDNGPELIAWALRDWCRLHHTTTSYIEPGSPWENPFVERASTAEPATSCSTSRSSAPSLRPGSSSRPGASSTTPTDPTRPSAASPPLSTPSNGPSTNQRSHDGWTTQRGPVTQVLSWSRGLRPSRQRGCLCRVEVQCKGGRRTWSPIVAAQDWH